MITDQYEFQDTIDLLRAAGFNRMVDILLNEDVYMKNGSFNLTKYCKIMGCSFVQGRQQLNKAKEILKNKGGIDSI